MSTVRLDFLVRIRGRRYSGSDLDRLEDEDVSRRLRLTPTSTGRVQVFVHEWVLGVARLAVAVNTGRAADVGEKG